tara:strand:+ start:67 stop:912 length:846 start_codon:yes stop_codon:yes gene_type:complete
MAHAFGSGGNGKTPFGGPPKGPSVKYGNDPLYCRQAIFFDLKVKLHSSGKTTVRATLSARTDCEKEKIEDVAVITVTQKNPGDKKSSDSPDTFPKNKGLCDAFSDIDGGYTRVLGQFVTANGMQKFMKDLSNETNNIPGFGLADFMSKLCAAKTRGGQGGGTAEYNINLICVSNVGDCEDGWVWSSTCGEDILIEIDLDGPINIPYDNLGGKRANIDPCLFSKLLDCWKKKPKANTDLSVFEQGVVVAGADLTAVPLPQDNIDKGAKDLMERLLKKCKNTR